MDTFYCKLSVVNMWAVIDHVSSMWILICKFTSVFQFAHIIIYFLILWHVIFIFFFVAAVTANCYLLLNLEYVSCNILVHIIHSTVFKNHNKKSSHLSLIYLLPVWHSEPLSAFLFTPVKFFCLDIHFGTLVSLPWFTFSHL
jgi:hypothetical protein